MPIEPLTPSELRALLSATPKAKRESKRTAQEIARIGEWNAELTLRRQTSAYHNVRSFEPREYRDIPALPKSPNLKGKRKRATRDDAPIFNAATVPVSYKLRNNERWRYYYTRSIAEWANAYARELITDGEFAEYIRNVQSMA